LIVLPIFRRPVSACLRSKGSAGLLAALLLRASVAGADLPVLAALDGASANEGVVLEYVRRAVGGRQEVDNTGSLTAAFGDGSPRTLLIAGLDEPGYVVSGITSGGYLRVHRLPAAPPHHNFDGFFIAQPVHITTGSGKVLNGVVAAPSVHLQSERAALARAGHPEQMWVDIGARSEQEARQAGADLLNPVTLAKWVTPLPRGRMSAPWISARAGAAILIGLARRLQAAPPDGAVILAFVSQQYSGNRGLARVLERVSADRVVWIKPGGGPRPAISPAADGAPQMADALAALAARKKLDFDRSAAERLSVPAFAKEEIWKDPSRIAAITLGVEHAGTPVEVLSPHSSEVAALLRDLVGIQANAGREGNAETRVRGETALQRLVNAYGVSGHEAPVRQAIQELLPEWARPLARTDKKGNLIVRIGENPERLFVSHMDEIGFEVVEVEEDGKLRAESRGGGTVDYFEFHPGMVHTDSGPLPAILLASQGGGLAQRIEVDIGAGSPEEAAAMGVRVGSTVTVRKELRSLLGARVTGRSLDDRLGCAVLVEVLRGLQRPQIKRPVWFAFTVEEETGLRGAGFLAETVHPKEVYAIDTFTSSDSPLENRRFAWARLGQGFVIRAMDSSGITPPWAAQRIADLARRHGIAVQYGVTSGANDGSQFVTGGAINIPLGWPLRYSHSPAEVADMDDVEALRKILRLLAAE
jgi:putative aminopeptidase FrvX